MHTLKKSHFTCGCAHFAAVVRGDAVRIFTSPVTVAVTKRLQRKADQSLRSGVDVENAWNLTSTVT